MSNIFGKLKAIRQAIPALDTTEITLELSSIHFDINQTTVGPNVPFTTEMAFEVRIDKEGKINLGTDKNTVQGFTEFLKKDVFKDLQINYFDVNEKTANPTALLTSDLYHTHVVLQTPEDCPLVDSIWRVWLRFKNEGLYNGDSSLVLFPQIVPNSPLSIPALADLNSVLKANYELLLLSNDTQSASSVGKVADEIADSVASLTSTIASKLSGSIHTRLQPAGGAITYDLALWAIIRRGTEDLSFTNYFNFMERVFCGTGGWSGSDQGAGEMIKGLRSRRTLPFMGVDAYQSVKIATEAFMMVNCMTNTFSEEVVEYMRSNVSLTNGEINQQHLEKWWSAYKESVNGGVSTIPYLAVIRRKLKDADLKTTSFEEALKIYSGESNEAHDSDCYGIIQEKLTHPCFLELIWSYWHEESMLVQGMNAIGRRFQNIKAPGARDPLAALNVDPLRPMNNLLWGYIQDEQHRLTVRRRAYEYDHHYGITLQGEAVRGMRPADSRSKFIEAFHMLLYLTNKFYRQADDMTVQPDAFPILNALREVHLILSEGAHNQYGDLPWTARAEMLIQQWLLARPEMREFLPTRVMIAYPEPWMDRVAALNNLMGWTKTSVMHFRDLGVFGEQLLLSIRFGNWANVIDRHSAGNWARFWRPQVQAYLHAYRAVTGVDLTAELQGNRIDATQPSIHLLRRLREQQQLPA